MATATDHKGGYLGGRERNGKLSTDRLDVTAQLAASGWPTPDAAMMNVSADPVTHEARRERLKAKHNNGNGAGLPIGQAVHLASWPTPCAVEPDQSPETVTGGPESAARKQELGRTESGDLQALALEALNGPARLTADGRLLTGSIAGMDAGGQLNPEHSRWLMLSRVPWERWAPGWREWQLWQGLIKAASPPPNASGPEPSAASETP